MSKFVAMLAASILAPVSVYAIEYHREAVEDLRVLILTGDFTPEDEPRHLASTIASYSPDVISFNSPGGSIYTAMEFGRIIRLHQVLTLQPRHLECVSACALAFLGGETRLAAPGAIGVHKSSFLDGSGLSTGDAVSAVQTATADVVAYLVEMGVEPSLLQLALRYESWDVRYLSGSEMVAHKVVTESWNGPETATEPTANESASASRQAPARPEYQRPKGPQDARGGTIRRPKDYAILMAVSTAAAELRVMENGARVAISGTTDRWYRAETPDGQRGWLHHTWVKVDEFYDGGFDARHVQIKSFSEIDDVKAYLVESPFALDAYVATNGWFAITLDGTYDEDEAVRLVRSLKASGRIPADSFQTYGNTYAEKLCCD